MFDSFKLACQAVFKKKKKKGLAGEAWDNKPSGLRDFNASESALGENNEGNKTQ